MLGFSLGGYGHWCGWYSYGLNNIVIVVPLSSILIVYQLQRFMVRFPMRKYIMYTAFVHGSSCALMCTDLRQLGRVNNDKTFYKNMCTYKPSENDLILPHT